MHDDDECGKALIALRCDLAPGHDGPCHATGNLGDDDFTLAAMLLNELSRAVAAAQRYERRMSTMRWVFIAITGAWFAYLVVRFVTTL